MDRFLLILILFFLTVKLHALCHLCTHRNTSCKSNCTNTIRIDQMSPSTLEAISVLKTPCGNLAFSKVLSISIPHCIVALEGFKTIVLPAISDGQQILVPASKENSMASDFRSPKGFKCDIDFLASVLITSSCKKLLRDLQNILLPKCTCLFQTWLL